MDSKTIFSSHGGSAAASDLRRVCGSKDINNEQNGAGQMPIIQKDRFETSQGHFFSQFPNLNIFKKNKLDTIKFIDLFAGIGGFRLAISDIGQRMDAPVQCMFSSDIDQECQKAYYANFDELPIGDIRQVDPTKIPNHDILLAGFPCQPFSICGEMKGFKDIRGTLFFEIVKILQAKQPSVFVLENVKLLAGHNQGRTLTRIVQALHEIGYKNVQYKVLNALDFGLPQKRERIFIVGFREPRIFEWPTGGVPMKPLQDILEKKVPRKFYASDYIRTNRLKMLKPTNKPAIWHENKAGHISAYPYSCALRAGASYNYLLVDGKRRLTPREMLRLQGFPDDYRIVCNDSQTRKQAGNSVPIPVVAAVLKNVFDAMEWNNSQQNPKNKGRYKQTILQRGFEAIQ